MLDSLYIFFTYFVMIFVLSPGATIISGSTFLVFFLVWFCEKAIRAAREEEMRWENVM